MATIAFSNIAGLGTNYPEAPPEMRSSISAFGFPTVLKRLHTGLRSAINRIPKNDAAGKPMRDHFLRCVAMGISDQVAVEKFCSKLGFESALRDLLEKRITQMTSVDMIVDPESLIPEGATYREVVEKFTGEDNKRFAGVKMRENETHDEWESFADEGPDM